MKMGFIFVNSPEQADIEIVVQLSTTNVTLVKVTINGSDETENETSTNPGTAKTCLIEGGKVGAGIELEGSISEVTIKDKAFKMQEHLENNGTMKISSWD